jgi:L-ascorbate metabolism protein UlaG (beta-lactamase superfamily)
MENREQSLFQRVLHFFCREALMNARSTFAAVLAAAIFVSGTSFAGDAAMKLKYLGHAAFELTTAAGAKIVFDPYTAGAFETLACDAIRGDFDVAITSHDHADHTCEEVLARSKNKVSKAGKATFGVVVVESFATFHDDAKGKKRGANLVSIVEADGFRVAHLGDLGHPITAKELPKLVGVDVMMIPVGGYYTIDAAAAAAIVKEFAPKIVVPMHYKTSKVDFPIAPVDSFTKLMKTVEKAGASEIVLTKEKLPARTTVVVLDPAN